MKRLFVAVTIACLGTMLVSVSAHAARNLAVDDKGNLFVADTDSILKFTPDGNRSTFASGLNDANDMAFDDKGNLFVRDGNTIFKFTPEGVKSTFASGIVPETYDPYHVAEVFTGLAPDRSGNLFVAEHVSGSILKFTPDGKKSTFACGVSPYEMAVDGAGNLFVTQDFRSEGVKSTFASGIVPETYDPYHVAEVFTGLAPDRSGNLFLAEHVSGSILKFTPDGKKSTFASGVSPYKMAVDGAGNLFVTQDVSSNLFVTRDVSPSIFKFTPEGKKSTLASGVSPDKMAVDGAGNLFAADGNTIFKFTPDGKKSTFATGINPGDLVFDRAGNLFVTDPGSDSILKFTPDGKKGTFATEISDPGDMAFDGRSEEHTSDSSHRCIL